MVTVCCCVVLWQHCAQAQNKQANNPVIFADVPDMSMIRVGNKLLHEQYYHAHEPRCAHHEV